jgi:hypothetical protein
MLMSPKAMLIAVSDDTFQKELEPWFIVQIKSGCESARLE